MLVNACLRHPLSVSLYFKVNTHMKAHNNQLTTPMRGSGQYVSTRTPSRQRKSGLVISANQLGCKCEDVKEVNPVAAISTGSQKMSGAEDIIADKR